MVAGVAGFVHDPAAFTVDLIGGVGDWSVAEFAAGGHTVHMGLLPDGLMISINDHDNHAG